MAGPPFYVGDARAYLPPRRRNGHALVGLRCGLRPRQDVPQRCWAACRLMPSREPISAQE